MLFMNCGTTTSALSRRGFFKFGRNHINGFRASSVGVCWNSSSAAGNVQASAAREDPDLATAKSFDEIPGFKGIWSTLMYAKDFLPIIGKYTKEEPVNFTKVHKERYKLFGEIYRIDFITGDKLVLVSNPDDIRKVFAHEGNKPNRRFLASMGKYRRSLPEVYGSAGILVETPEKWYQTRSKVQVPMLRPQIVETYVDKMSAVSQDFVERMKSLRNPNQNMEIDNYLQELYKWALESIGLIAFNTRLGCLKDNLSPDSEALKMIQAANDTLEGISDLEFGLQFWRIFPTKTYKKVVAAQEYFRSVAIKYYNRTLEKIKNSKDDDDLDFGILGVFIQKKDLDRREVFTFMLDLLLAGIDTTSNSISFALYHFARNQEAQQLAYEEIKKLLPNKNQPITVSTLRNIPYLKACVKESMRMLPVADGTHRILDHDIALSGYRVPAKTIVIVLPMISSLQPEYFDEPEKFKPERWLQKTKPHPYANLPFGHGPRMCIGKRVAQQEMYVLLIKLLQNFRVEYHHEDIGQNTRFVNVPDKPLRFSFIDRK